MEHGTDLDFCLLIPCYNNIEGLKKSLLSIEYDCDKHIVVIVDDGSDLPVTFESLKIQECNSRVQIINLPENRGITYALNVGLDWISDNSNAKYIARLDCNDICDETRFYKQVTFLNKHPQIGLLGSWCFFKDEDSTSYIYKTPTEHDAIWKGMHFRNLFIHPTVMFRTEVLLKVGIYPYDYPYAEDYALFWKMLKATKTAILNEPLVTCAINAKGISAANRKIQMHSCRRIITNFGENNLWKYLGIGYAKTREWLPQKLILRLKQLRA
jgi:glycosyltransferase involved in cell wall biosynthesis